MSYTVGCYCCTCKPVVSSAILEWDPACRNHGAHGLRACAEHKREAVNCDCGCGYRVRHQDPDKAEHPALKERGTNGYPCGRCGGSHLTSDCSPHNRPLPGFSDRTLQKQEGDK